MSGAQGADLYVVSSHRGLGVALALVAGTAAEIRAERGAFLRGDAYDRESTRRAYGRIAVVEPSGETHLSGRVFRQFGRARWSTYTRHTSGPASHRMEL